jgi:hypothetical protein
MEGQVSTIDKLAQAYIPKGKTTDTFSTRTKRHFTSKTLMQAEHEAEADVIKSEQVGGTPFMFLYVKTGRTPHK